MNDQRYNRKGLTTFFVIVIILSAITEAAYCMGAPGWLVAVLMWIPALSGLIGVLVSLRDNGEKVTFKAVMSGIGVKRCKIRYILMGVIIPFIYLFIPYRIYWTLYPENFAYHGVPLPLVLKDVALYTVICVIMGLLTGTGEELGWRGFMLPALLERIGLEKAIAVVSLFWCFWHFPLLIWGGYMDGAALWYKLIAFVFCIFPVGVIAAILTVRSGSVWPAAFLHAAHNAYDQQVFALITRGENLMYYVSETGLLTILCAWIIAIIMYVTYKKSIREVQE